LNSPSHSPLFQSIDFKKLLLIAALAACPAAFTQDKAAPAADRSSGTLPTLGDGSELSAAAERRIGDRIAGSIYRDPDFLDDAILQDYLQSIWQPLIKAAKERGDVSPELQDRFAWELFLIRDRSVNAFALPGGYLGVHLGLIGVVSSADELAAVLGHELSHVSQRHISRLITQQSRSTPWMIGAMILGALAASKNPQAANALMTGGQALAAQSQLNFSRDMEREADRVGIGIMTAGGFDPRGAYTMFEKLQQSSRLNDSGSYPYLRSHPLTTERLGDAQARFQLMPALSTDKSMPASDAKILHAMMAARARVLAEPGVDVLRSALGDAQRAGTNASVANEKTASALYGGALAAAKLRDFKAANALSAQLITLVAKTDTTRADPAHAARQLALEVELLAGVVPTGAAQMDINKSNNTGQRADVLLQSRASLAAGRAADVSGTLLNWVTARPKDVAAWQLLAQAYGKQGKEVRAIWADAEARVVQLDYAAALDRLKAAQGMMRSNPASGDFMDGSIVDTRVRQVELLAREQALQDKLDR
jgi:predicted Zn-dependent protease